MEGGTTRGFRTNCLTLLHTSLLNSSKTFLASSAEVSSSSMETSPRGEFKASALSSRRMILPDLVFGTFETKNTVEGSTTGPMLALTCFLSSSLSSELGS